MSLVSVPTLAVIQVRRRRIAATVTMLAVWLDDRCQGSQLAPKCPQPATSPSGRRLDALPQ